MQKLTVSPKVFGEMISDLIKSGVTFDAEENNQGYIEIEFLGGY